jgi:hypothetical protein
MHDVFRRSGVSSEWDCYARIKNNLNSNKMRPEIGVRVDFLRDYVSDYQPVISKSFCGECPLRRGVVAPCTILPYMVTCTLGRYISVLV